MKCRVCGKEIEEGSEFCRYCGAAQKKKRKPTWSERKRERERETAEIIKKSYLTEQDVLLAVPAGTEGLEIKEVGETRKVFTKCVLLSVLYLIITAAALAGLVVMIRFTEGVMSRTLRAVICFALLLLLAGFGAAFAERSYSARVFSVMNKSVRAVKKVSYGKAPYITSKGKLYQLICNAKCIVCGASVHIEEFDGRLYEVCDYDRTHLCVLSTRQIFGDLLGEDFPEEQGKSFETVKANNVNIAAEDAGKESNTQAATKNAGLSENNSEGETDGKE